MAASSFRVVIVGGGIGGLALAISLQHAGIDYKLIEKAKDLDPQVGASIGILPNGARILDQLGCFNDLAAQTVDMVSTASHAADGSLIGKVSDTLSLMKRRTGYPVFFIDRQLLLRTLAKQIHEPHRILLQTSVRSIEQNQDKAIVHCSDGTKIEADIVVGSDGVHSFVRQEMWRQADDLGEGETFSQDKKAMSASYKCLFGISESISGMEPGQTDRTYAKGLSTLSYVGKEGRLFWFVFIQMDKVYHPPSIPKFTSDDITAMIQEHGSLPIREHKIVTISDLYERRICCNLVPIEEAEYQQWSYGRLVCMGDSIHKMTPNLGAGASSAIESAAVLSNTIVRLASISPRLSLSTIRLAFDNFQQSRMLRVGRTMKTTNKLTRLQALQTTKDYIVAHYIAPLVDDYYAEVFSSFVIGAPLVEHLPTPERSLQGTMPFNPKQGWGYEEPTTERFFRALPFIVLTLFFSGHASPLNSWLPSVTFSKPGNLALLQNRSDFLASSRQTLALLLHCQITYGIWLLEAGRLANKASLIQFPILFGFGWYYWGFAATAPLYFFLLYLHSSIGKFRASDMRLTDLSYSYSVGPLIFLLGTLPAYLRHIGLDSITGRSGNSHDVIAQWNEWPSPKLLVLLSALQFLFARFLRPSTIRSDRIRAHDRDIASIRFTTSFFAVVAGVVWMGYLSERMKVLAWSGATVSSSSTSATVHMLIVDLYGQTGIALALSVSFWLALTFRDLHTTGMINGSWTAAALLGFMIFACLGPGTMLVIGWQLREEALLSRRHKDAVTMPLDVKDAKLDRDRAKSSATTVEPVRGIH